MSKLKLMDDLSSISSITINALSGFNDYARSIKESEGRLTQAGKTFSMTEVRGLPQMNPHRVNAAIAELEVMGRQFKRDVTKQTQPYQLDVNDVRLIYKQVVKSFADQYHRSARVIAGLNLKGGVGKTTFIANLAAGLVRSRTMLQHQLRVLLIDLDPQGSCSLAYGYSDVGQTEEQSAVQAILKQIDSDTLKSWIKPTRTNGLDILPAYTSDAFFSVGAGSFAQKHNKKLTQLLKEYVIEPLKNDYDVILVDCGPHLDSALLNALSVADAMIVPVGVDPLEFDSSLKFMARLHELFELIDNPPLTKEKIKILATKVDYTNGKHTDNLSIINQLYPEMVLNKTMQFLRPFGLAISTQETIYEIPPKFYQGSVNSLNKVLSEFDGIVNEIFSSLIASE